MTTYIAKQYEPGVFVVKDRAMPFLSFHTAYCRGCQQVTRHVKRWTQVSCLSTCIPCGNLLAPEVIL